MKKMIVWKSQSEKGEAHLHVLVYPTKVTGFSWSWQGLEHLILFEAPGHIPSLAPYAVMRCPRSVAWLNFKSQVAHNGLCVLGVCGELAVSASLSTLLQCSPPDYYSIDSIEE